MRTLMDRNRGTQDDLERYSMALAGRENRPTPAFVAGARGAQRMRMFTKTANLAVLVLTAACGTSSANAGPPPGAPLDGSAGAEGGKEASPANLPQFESGADPMSENPTGALAPRRNRGGCENHDGDRR